MQNQRQGRQYMVQHSNEPAIESGKFLINDSVDGWSPIVSSIMDVKAKTFFGSKSSPLCKHNKHHQWSLNFPT